jgi:hypothetical protein
MNKRTHEHLLSELGEIKHLLEITPESSAIDRLSLRHRKSQIQSELETTPPPNRWPVAVQLVFNGRPVVDGQGIEADFCQRSIDVFSKMVSSLAASDRDQLGQRGVIPNREDYRLMITGTSHGSFGLQFEEVSPQSSLTGDESPVARAVGHATDILEVLAGDDEDGVAETIEDTDTRALRDVREFLKVMADNDAVCSLSFNRRVFRFSDVGQVRRSLSSIEEDNIRKDNVELVGHFQGYLPKDRRAEFVIEETGEVISARVDRRFEDAESINQMLDETTTIRARTFKLGASRPRYTILGHGGADDWMFET